MTMFGPVRAPGIGWLGTQVTTILNAESGIETYYVGKALRRAADTKLREVEAIG